MKDEKWASDTESPQERREAPSVLQQLIERQPLHKIQPLAQPDEVQA
jgi:hypothetical protein